MINSRRANASLLLIASVVGCITGLGALPTQVTAQESSRGKSNSSVSKETESTVPGAPRLLPQDTLAYLRLDNADEFRDALSESSMGRMLADPALRPFASDIYQIFAELFLKVGEPLGLTLDELLAIPTGQVSVAAMPGNLSDEQSEAMEDQADQDDESPDAIRRRIARKRRQQNSFGGLFVVEAGSNQDKLESVVEKIEQLAQSAGYVRRVSKIDQTNLIKMLPPRPGRPEVEYFFCEQTLVFGIGHGTAAKALDQWLGKSEEPTLADRADFTSVMSRSIGAEDTRPQMTFFFDPYHIVERIVKRGGAAGLVWPIIEDLGLGKIRGIGGSSFRGGEFFEEISHAHLLIDAPRDGFFGVLRPEVVDSAPPNWVPSDVTSYTTVQWDFPTAFDNMGKVLEMWQGPEPMKRLVQEPMQKRLGVDVYEDVLEQLSGRYVSCRWVQPPIKLNSQVQLHAFGIKDSVKAKAVIAQIRERASDRFEVATAAGNVIYLIKTDGRGKMPDSLRKPEPCFAVYGKWLMFSDSKQFLERAMLAGAGSLPRLVTVPQYELVSSELGGKLDGEKPFMVSFLRSSEYVRQFYELAQSPDAGRFLEKQGENNPLAAKMAELLRKNQLPPFQQFEKYFAPSGSFAYDEPSGIHLGSFTLRAEE